jgi:hypothetical protein
MTDQTVALHPAGTATADASSASYTPIIFVPGVMGSRFTTTASERAWDPDDTGAMALWISHREEAVQRNKLALSVSRTSAVVISHFPSTAELTDGNAHSLLLNEAIDRLVAATEGKDKLGELERAKTITEFYAERGWAGVSWAFYGALLMYLETNLNPDPKHPHCPVYAFGYDWRQSNAISGAQLSSFVSSVLAKNPSAKSVIVVTHSMGGLVTRGALAYDSAVAAKIRGVVHCLQPSNGAVACYRRFYTGATAPLDPVTEFIPDNVLQNILGPTSAAFAYNMSDCDGPLELLPNHVYQKYYGSGKWLAGIYPESDLANIYEIYSSMDPPGLAGFVKKGQDDLGTDAEKNGDSVVKRFVTRMTSAKGFHGTVETVAHPHTYALYSTGRSTDDSIEFLAPDYQLPPQADRWSIYGGPVEFIDTQRKIIYRQKADGGDGTVPEVRRCSTALPTLSS